MPRPPLQFGSLPLAAVSAFADAFKHNGDISSLPTDETLQLAELERRVHRVLPEVQRVAARHGITMDAASAVAHAKLFVDTFGESMTPDPAPKFIVLRPPEHMCCDRALAITEQKFKKFEVALTLDSYCVTPTIILQASCNTCKTLYTYHTVVRFAGASDKLSGIATEKPVVEFREEFGRQVPHPEHRPVLPRHDYNSYHA
jgi:hypothetical protein